MITRTALNQFLADGLYGILAAVLLFMLPAALVLTGFLVFGSRSDLAEFLEVLNLFYDLLSIAFWFFCVTFIAFIGSGMGGRFVENIVTRQDWMTCILKIVGVSWITGLLLMILGAWMLVLFNMIDLMTVFLSAIFMFVVILQMVIPVTGCLSGIGFVFVGLLAIAVNPEKRFYRMLIASIASSAVGYSFGAISLALHLING